VQQAIQQELEGVLSRLEKGLPPDVYEKVLQLMATEDDEVQSPAPERILERLLEP
jgi:hypothetical protein